MPLLPGKCFLQRSGKRYFNMGTIKQISALIRKIEKQPFGLNLIAGNILEILKKHK